MLAVFRDVEDDPSWSSEAFTVQSKKRRPLIPVRLSEVMQQVIVDYLRDHDFLYIKSALDYKDSNKREECMVEMAGMVELSGKCTVQFVYSIHT